MIFGLWPTLAWAAEFVLETSGSIFAYRRKLSILSFLLGWRALFDIVTFFLRGNAYGYTMWAGRAVQYAILYALGIQLAAKMVQEYRPLTRYIYKALALVASAATYIFVTTELWERKFLHAEAVSSLLLLAVVLIGWIGKKKRLEEPWSLISCAVVLGAGGNAVCSVLAAAWPNCLSLYPIPALAALILWNLSVLPRKPKAPVKINTLPENYFAELPDSAKEALDINFWFSQHRVCPNCWTDLHLIGEQANLWPHWVGDCKQWAADDQDWLKELKIQA